MYQLSNKSMLEFYGIMMGDGCISQYPNENRVRKASVISGNSIKDLQYFEKYLIPLIYKLFKIRVKTRFVKGENTIRLYSVNRKIFDYLKKEEYPVGVKGQIRIPEKIMKLPVKRLNHLVRGFFDTDGYMTARKDEKYRYPHIFMTTVSNPLRKQLKHLLLKQGFTVYSNKWDVVVKGNTNCKKWFKLIGSSNPRNLNRYNEWKETGRIASVGKK